jgi:hypothetical protein
MLHQLLHQRLWSTLSLAQRAKRYLDEGIVRCSSHHSNKNNNINGYDIDDIDDIDDDDDKLRRGGKYQRYYELEDFVTNVLEYTARMGDYFQSLHTGGVSMQELGREAPRLIQCVVTIRDRFESEFMLLPLRPAGGQDSRTGGPLASIAGFVWIPYIACKNHHGVIEEDIAAYLRQKLIESASDTARRITHAVNQRIEWSLIGYTQNRAGEAARLCGGPKKTTITIINNNNNNNNSNNDINSNTDDDDDDEDVPMSSSPGDSPTASPSRLCTSARGIP